jgi:squalene-hopene/tetraprenyl-beta-curcumene cyclase
VQYPGAGPDLSATAKAYFALKLCGDDPEAPHMKQARELVLSLGGAELSNTYSRFYYAALGQLHYDNVPAVPPEFILLPRWSYFHPAKVSAWSRTMIMPLSIITTYRPLRELPEGLGIEELYQNPQFIHRPVLQFGESRPVSWQNAFRLADRALKLAQRLKLTPLRRKAIQQVERWLLEHTKHSDGLGAIYPPMVYLIIALRCLGYSEDEPHMIETHRQLDALMIEDERDETIRLQPCFSPVWDSGIAAYTLTECGYDAHHEPTRRVAEWLVRKECREVVGDWKANVPEPVEPSGWFFEFNNAFYPDVDDTAMVAMALHRIDGSDRILDSAQRGVHWMLAMQNPDGGWAAFDRTRDRPLLEEVPFADHNAIQDPSCPDITGRVLECLGHHGYATNHPAVIRALRFIRSQQEPEGCWFGRWGVNYIYGTWQVVCGLRNVGVDMTEPWVREASRWLKRVQHDDGAFGESADSYEDDSLKGHGPATASQTAWGTMALMAIEGPDDPDVKRGIRWLIRTQLRHDDPETGDRAGSWREDWFTGTGFPRVFYLRYHLYRLYFPIMCLGRWLRLSGQAGAEDRAEAGQRAEQSERGEPAAGDTLQAHPPTADS